MSTLRTTGFFFLFIILLLALVNLAGAQETPKDTTRTVFRQESLSGSPAKSTEETLIELSTDHHAVVHTQAKIKLLPSAAEAAQEAANPVDSTLAKPPKELQEPFPTDESSLSELQVDLSQRAPRVDLAGHFVGLPQSSRSPSTTGESCEQLLGNTQLDAPGGSIAPWVIPFQNVYGSTANFVSPSHSIYFEDNDPGDTSPDFDAFGQAFSTPSNLTRVIIKYATNSFNSDPNDNAGGELYTVDAGGYLDEYLGGWEVGESPDNWQWQTVEITDKTDLAAMEGKDLFIGFYYDTSASTPNERVYFDDITFTACAEDAPDSYIVVKKQTDPTGSAQKFTFDPSWSGANFQLSHGQSKTSPALVPGTYSVTELAQSGWELENVTCSDGSDPNSISLQKGETVTCTFNNRQLAVETCGQILVNTQLDVVEFDDDSGSAEPWVTIFPIVWYAKDSAEAYDGYSLGLEDGDAGDPDPLIDMFGQGFQMPANLTKIEIEYYVATWNTNEADEAFGQLYVLDDDWVLHWPSDQYFAGEWDVAESEADGVWLKHVVTADNQNILNKLSGKKAAILLFNNTDGGGDKEWVYFDNIMLTVCSKETPTAGKAFMPSIMTNYGKVSGPICTPPGDNPLDQWYANRGLVQTGATCNSTLSAVDRADYYTFKPTESGNHTLRLTNLPEGSEWAAMIFFDQTSPGYAPGGASDGRCRITDPGNGPKQVICNLDKNKDYFVKVSAGSTPMAGSYQMRITKP